jgi:peptide/nickel transport system substrate-binding protein
MRRIHLAAASTAITVLLGSAAGCSSLASSAAGTGNSIITISNGGTGQFTDNFNPFSPTAASGTLGMVYEPLMFFNTGRPNDVEPLLATNYQFSDGGRKLTFTLRSGVKWSDGQPFSSADVAYTFNLLRNPALNLSGTPLLSAVATDPTHVVLTYKTPQYSQLPYIAGYTYMVPEHIWKTVKNPSTFVDAHPVGTGPYELSSFTPQQFLMVKNPHYWEPGKPQVHGFRFVSYTGNDSADAALSSGQLDWDSVFMPDVQKQYVDQDPAHNKFANIPTVTTVILPNLAQGPLSDLAVRQAMDLGLNRTAISESAWAGLASAANPTLLIKNSFSNDIAPQYLNETPGYDPAKAKQILEQAGYTMSNGVFHDRTGKPLTITCLVTAGYTDWITALQVMQQQLAAIGITLHVQQLSNAAVNSAEQNGTFQMALTNIGAQPTPYLVYDGAFSSAYTAPVGKPAVSNYSRFSSPAVDSALSAIAGTDPHNTAAIKAQLIRIENVIVNQLPYIPIVQASGLTEYNTQDATGWPTPANLYAQPQPFYSPDLGIVAKNLVPVR